jgi:anti-anti-sigma factor
MTIRVSKAENNKTITIAPVGRFTFEMAREFRSAYRDEPPTMQYIIDLSETDYMDSAALGMLLLLLQHVEEKRERVRLIKCKPDITNLLEMAQFHKRFVVE